jgi:hypothetical protein
MDKQSCTEQTDQISKIEQDSEITMYNAENENSEKKII